jgi:hypothetical protein
MGVVSVLFKDLAVRMIGFDQLAVTLEAATDKSAWTSI